MYFIHPAIPDSMVHLNGYHLLRFDRLSSSVNVKKRGGGVAYYISELYDEYVETLSSISKVTQT